jgi:TolB-like protein/DNA-binding winged helix-turn-helix (wHTH) protein/Tfp pilus assembly protein PilF
MRLIIFDPSASVTSRSHGQYGENGGLSSKLTLIVSKFILRMDIAAEHKVYEFDDFRIDVDHLMLSHQGSEIPLVPKAVETLVALIEHRGKIVSKDELLEAVWPDTVVEESNLFLYLSLLRKTLGTHKDGSPYVETLRRRGYRFNGDVHLTEEEIEDKQYAGVVENHGQSRTNIQSQSGRLYVVKDWERKTESREASYASSAVPALKPVESANGLLPAENESMAVEVSAATQRSAAPLQHANVPGAELPAKAVGFKRPKIRYVIAVSLGVILLGVVVAGSFYWRSRRVVPTSIDRPKTIAILPFRPLVDQNRDEALELGMADTLITRLGNNKAITVRPLSSVRNFQGPDRDAINAGKALGVEAVLDPSIQRSGDRIRVNVTLIKVADGTTLWADTFDKHFTDIFVVQDSIATSIVNALALNLNSEERTRLAKRYTSNPDALDYYNRGRVNELKITKEGLLKAIDFFDQAIKADPNYALAYAHKADAYRVLGMAGFANYNDVLPKVLELAQRALEIDGSLAEAHLQVAWYESVYLRNLTVAETKFKRVIEMSPNDFQAHIVYALFFSFTNRHAEAVAEARRARELSPMTPLMFALESQILLRAGHEEEAILQAKKALDFEPNFWVAHLHLGSAYASQNQYDQATAEYEKAIQLAPETFFPKTALARLFVRTGDHKKAYEIVRELESRRSERFVPLSQLAAIYNGLGNKDRALDLLEKAVEEGGPFRLNLREPLFDNLRSEPRFQNILKRMNVDK